MARTQAQLKSLISSKLGQATGTLTEADFLAGMNLALDALRMEVDFPEAEKTSQLTPALFKDVIVYTPPTDLYGDAIIDIRPLVEIPPYAMNNNWMRNTTVAFETNLLGDRSQRKWTIEYNGTSKYLRLLTDLENRTKNTTLNNCDTYDGNGTWTADTTNSDANTVATSTTNYFEGSGAVSFNVTVGQSANDRAVIYDPAINTVDISLMSSPYLFFYVYLPSVTNFTSVNFYIGSDTGATPSTKANYYTFTATTQFDGSALVAGRNLIGVSLASATQTGTVTTTAIKYLELRLNYSASYTSQTGVLLDGVIMREGMLYEARYYSKYLVSTANSVLQQYFVNDDDYLLLNSDGERLFVEYAAGYLAPNLKDPSGATYYQLAELAVKQYKARYPQSRRSLMFNYYYADASLYG